MPENYKPLPPPVYKYTKGFNGLFALFFWIACALVILYFTKENNPRLEIFFYILAVADAILGVLVVYQVVTGKNIRKKGEQY
jgi:pilus assembly protein TadC